MKYYNFILMLAALFALPATGRTQTDSAAKTKAILDSMFKNDPFFQMLDSLDAPTSYLDISVSMGNGVFSTQNNNLNAEQIESRKLFFVPTLSYQHKTGFGLGLSTFLASDKGRFKAFQYTINPFYTYNSKNIQASISYSRIIPASSGNSAASPFSNDLFASVKWRKPWLVPGIYVGLATGKYTDYVDTTIRIPLTNPPRFRNVKDTIENKLSDFLLSASIEHVFSFDRVFSPRDNISFTPVLMLTAGRQQINTTHSNSLDRFPRVQRYFKNKYGDGESKSSFILQSLNFSADLVYGFGKFYAEPMLFLDYYLPATTEKRLTAVFSFTVGVTL
jgi:hypothetical protein